MATLTPEQTYAQARAAGFSSAQAVIMTAIAMGESDLHTDAKGDTTITTSTWGPSIGLWQVRTLQPAVLAKASGSDKLRDASKLTDPAYNARAAFAISGKGKTFQPWSVYTSGTYKKYLTRAQQAAANVGSGTATGSGASVKPVKNATVSTPFGKSGPMWSATGGKHTGDDYAVPVGTAVFATAPGVVEASGASGSGFGNWVKVKLANGYEAIYGHLSSEKVKVGDKVTAGQQIALSGASGNVTGPHLHYEVRKDGKPVNPSSATSSLDPVAWWNPLDGLGVAGDAIGDAAGAVGGIPGRIGGAIGDGVGAAAGATADAVGHAIQGVFTSGPVRDLMTRSVFLILGGALVVIGAAKLAAPAAKSAAQTAAPIAAAVATKGAA